MRTTIPPAGNPLLSGTFEIPFRSIEPKHFEPAIEQATLEAQENIERIVHQSEKTFENTLLALDLSTEKLEYAMGIIMQLEGVNSSPESRTAYNRAFALYSEFTTQIFLNSELWNAIKTYASSEEAKQLTGPRAQRLEQISRAFQLHGADLSDEKKTRFQEISKRLTEITSQFGQNVLDSTNQWKHHITDVTELSGMPESLKDQARADAQAQHLDGYLLTLQGPTVSAILIHADNRELRKLIWHGYQSIATQEPYDNRSLIEEILKLRQEEAEIMGFQDFSDLMLSDRMAKSGEVAWNFLRDLYQKVLPFRSREIESLENYKKSNGDDTTLEPWDSAYWMEKQRKAEFCFDHEKLKPYFSLERVTQGLFQISETLFGIQITEIPNDEVWHPEVKYFEVRNPEGEHLGSFYTDWFPRSNKRSGAWAMGLITGNHWSGRREPHLAAMTGNLSRPTQDKPALLTHRDVETVFHEFGHVLHKLLSRAEIRGQAGTRVAHDFVELPSQIMENWCTEPEALKLFAKHYETGESLPDTDIEKLIQAQNHGAALAFMRQLSLGTVDMALHRFYAKNPTDDAETYAHAVMQDFYHWKIPHKPGYLCGFGHIFRSHVGYAAGYYAYKWAEVLEADAFTRFKEEGILSRDTGMAFVETILSQGGSQDPQKLFEDFMGRKPDPKALLVREGLI